MSSTRADLNRNPTAFITQIAVEAGLKLGVDYSQGDSFTSEGVTYFTAHLLGDPVGLTIKVINTISFETPSFQLRWTYINMPRFVWNSLTNSQKRDVIGFMYQREGGTAMRALFPNYGKL